MAAVILTSCDRNIQYAGNFAPDRGRWSMYDPAQFTFTIEDTLQTWNVGLSLRTTSDYPYRNIYLFLVTDFPSGYTITDTLHARVADEKGRWLGRGAGDLRELTIPYKSNVWFPEGGEYHLTVVHGMRDTLLRGVNDLGIKITRVREKAK